VRSWNFENNILDTLTVDEKMMELMKKLPDGWNVATNGNGEKANQNLVFSYGQKGC
jgi:hypothetical protein